MDKLQYPEEFRGICQKVARILPEVQTERENPKTMLLGKQAVRGFSIEGWLSLTSHIGQE